MIPTAEEFLNNINNINYRRLKQPNPHLDILPFIEADLIEFAKMHVEEALKQASEKATTDGYGDGYAGIDEESILTAYPLENIK